MAATRVLVLGGTGMLGSMVTAVLGATEGIEVVVAGRTGEHAIDARHDDPATLLDAVRPAWVVNAIGVLASFIDHGDAASVERARDVNTRFPHRLAQAAAAQGGVRIVHATTDGVFSGFDGPYDESAPHDAVDVYGRSKSLGEAPGPEVVNLRCSIVGPELGERARSLLGWLLAQPRGARLTGYEDQRWNGITTLHFARLCAAIVLAADPPAGVVHVVPADTVTKAELLELLARAHGRHDLIIEPGPSPIPADRTLATVDPARNRALWRAAGHPEPPTIAAMVADLASRRQ